MRVLKQGKKVADIDLRKEKIETPDEILDSLFYQLLDEGIPIEVKPGITHQEEMTEENLSAFLKEQGYELKVDTQ